MKASTGKFSKYDKNYIYKNVICPSDVAHDIGWPYYDEKLGKVIKRQIDYIVSKIIK